ncbi:MAG: 16S rRNA (cytidine(1402)-2'-O)-methyltransferase [Chloroflexota bacterium]|nr:16S rRNA (cytidine(1402)-2'-O)-methyltransferase [Chloroflexota bacterium]
MIKGGEDDTFLLVEKALARTKMDKITATNYNYPVVPALYVIATPIGNLEDISLRALRLLQEVKLIAAEDTRTTRQLLNAYNIKTPLTSYHEHNKWSKLDYLLRFLEKQDVALVSEAGMPGLSDPGYEFIVAAIAHGIPVVPIPGASAAVTALIVSGLPTDQFIYLGFLPRRQGQRKRFLSSIANESRTIVAFEAPHRLQKALKDIEETLGDRRVTVCRELSKAHEEIFRGRVSRAGEHFTEPRGEFTLVVEGKAEEENEVTEEMERKLQELYQRGLKAKEAISQISGTRTLSRKKLYQTWLSLKKGG